MITNWNVAFTTLIRRSRPAYWGNWGLDSSIKAGAVGTLDPNTGAFTFIDQLPNVKTADTPTSSHWQVSSDNVRRSQSDVKLDGSGKDPDTGTQITAGLEVKWGFDSAGMIASEFAVAKESQIIDSAALGRQNYDFLKSRATNVGMASPTGISQGFGFVSSVIWAASGLNLGSQSDSSDFSLSGSVNGVNELVGAKAGLSGSYTNSTSNKAMEQRIYPETPNAKPAGLVPVAFTFTSCHNDLFIPNWTRQIGAFELVLLNKPGCTYIVDANLNYRVPGQADHQENTSISGGLSRTFGDIPLAATNITLDLAFKGMFSSDKKHFEWPTPLGQWIDGQRHVEMTGVWPGKSTALDRESGDSR